MRCPAGAGDDDVMDIRRSVIVSIIVRVAGLLVAAAGSGLAYRALGAGQPDASADADFGGGWVVLGAVVVLAAAWGAWDGWHRRLGAVALTWLATGVVVGATALSVIDWGAPRHVVLTDFPIITVGCTGLVLLPALAVGAMTARVRSSAHPG
jgi:hypothetical protein